MLCLVKEAYAPFWRRKRSLLRRRGPSMLCGPRKTHFHGNNVGCSRVCLREGYRLTRVAQIGFTKQMLTHGSDVWGLWQSDSSGVGCLITPSRSAPIRLKIDTLHPVYALETSIYTKLQINLGARLKTDKKHSGSITSNCREGQDNHLIKVEVAEIVAKGILQVRRRKLKPQHEEGS